MVDRNALLIGVIAGRDKGLSKEEVGRAILPAVVGGTGARAAQLSTLYAVNATEQETKRKAAEESERELAAALEDLPAEVASEAADWLMDNLNGAATLDSTQHLAAAIELGVQAALAKLQQVQQPTAGTLADILARRRGRVVLPSVSPDQIKNAPNIFK